VDGSALMRRAIISAMNFAIGILVMSLVLNDSLADISVSVFVVKFVHPNVLLVPTSKYQTMTENQGKNIELQMNY